MKKFNFNFKAAQKKPILVGVLVVVFVMFLGFGIAYATGLTAPHQAQAYDGGELDDEGGVLPIDGGGPDEGGLDGYLGGLGGDLGGGLDNLTGDNGGNLDTPPDTDTPPCNCDNTPPVVAPTPPDTDTPPCNCDNTPPVVAPTPPDTDTPPCNCDNTPPVVTPPDTDTPPCNCDNTPPVITPTPPEDTTPPETTPPVITPECAEGDTGTYPNCTTPVTPPPPPSPTPAECISLTGTPHEITPGQAVTLTWQTQNATSISIDQGIGAVSPVSGGSIVVHPTTDTTYTATVTNAVNSVNCQTSVVIETTPPPVGPACISLSANATTITPGQPVVLSWVTSNASSISIDNGVGNVTPVSAGSTTVYPTAPITYTATVPGAPQNSNCVVSVNVVTQTGGGGGGTGGGSSGGYGGGGGSSGGTIITPAPVASQVYLSQIPYTGLDLGTFGTIVYWTLLVLWCAAAAYLVIFNLIPFLFHRLTGFGSNVNHLLNQPAGAGLAMAGAAGHGTYAPAHGAPQQPHVVQSTTTTTVKPSQSAYSAAKGFSSFAPAGEALTIDDIVNGLSRLPEVQNQNGYSTTTHTEAQITEHPTYQSAHQVITAPAQHTAPRADSAAAAISTDIRDFCAALLNGDRDTVFGTLRQIVREGGDAEMFITQVVCALDDAYRNRLDGTKVNPEIARLTQNCATPFLERLTGALTNAVDSSYSAGITGSKLALTRALAVVEG